MAYGDPALDAVDQGLRGDRPEVVVAGIVRAVAVPVAALDLAALEDAPVLILVSETRVGPDVMTIWRRPDGRVEHTSG